MREHTVEKIGGTSMSNFETVLDNVIIGKRKPFEIYNRIFIVSAYGGITNMLLEHKKSSVPGVYQYFKDNNPAWESTLESVRDKMLEINQGFKSIGLENDIADNFISARIDETFSCLKDLKNLCSYGHFTREEFLPTVRELLSSIGEAHSAFNSVNILKNRGINAVFVDLTGWMNEKKAPLDAVIQNAFENIRYDRELPIVTGYAKCTEGLMAQFDRGYSEITFSKIATVTKASEGIIHKEYHLCSADPVLLGTDKVKIIGRTNYDVADQLADLGMEAIHPKATKEMLQKKIPIRVKNVFDPGHEGTLISDNSYKNAEAKVEIVCGKDDVTAIELWDPEMIGQYGYDYTLLSFFEKHGISYISKIATANTITHFVSSKDKKLEDCINEIKGRFKTANFNIHRIAIVSVIGTNLNTPGIMSGAAIALSKKNINILGCIFSMRQVNIQFIIEKKDYLNALQALHSGLIEK
ncbi:MAG: aspartate kinase [Oligoflexia bacterium]|nr:aspartate kinase [Oligoflexia bacterium]